MLDGGSIPADSLSYLINNYMYYYIYQITNLVNNKIYVGKHKSKISPELNGYYGSGKLIQRAILKYGIDSFKKEVLHFCNNVDDMARKEAEIVTEQFVIRTDTYNMHKGGNGGFDHINNLPKEERINIRELKRKIASGEIVVGGSKHWTEESRRKVVAQSWGNKIKNGWSPNNWEKKTVSEQNDIRQKLSNSSSGQNNSQYGRMWISNVETKEVKRILNSDPIPQGWVRGKKGKEKTTCWVNDVVSEYLIKIEEKQEYFGKGFESGRLTLSMPQSRTVV